MVYVIMMRDCSSPLEIRSDFEAAKERALELFHIRYGNDRLYKANEAVDNFQIDDGLYVAAFTVIGIELDGERQAREAYLTAESMRRVRL